MAPTTATALISRLVVTACQDFWSVTKATKFLSVYWEGSGAVRQEPLTENASRKIIAIGSTKKIVASEATTARTIRPSGLVTRLLRRAPPLDNVAYAERLS